MGLFRKIANAFAVVATVLATMSPPVYAGLPSIPPSPLTSSAISRVGGAIDYKARFFAAKAAATVRNPRLLSDDPTMVAITVSSAAPVGKSKFPINGTVAGYRTYFKLEGGWPVYDTSAFALKMFGAHTDTTGADWTTQTTNTAPVAYRVSFYTSDPASVIQVGGNLAIRPRFLINDQYVNKLGNAPATVDFAAQYYTMTFPNAAPRKITIELQKKTAFSGVYIGTTYNILPVQQAKPRVLVIADSFGVGPDIGTGITSDTTLIMQGNGIYQQAADWNGCEYIVSAIGGTDFDMPLGSASTYVNRYADVAGIIAATGPVDAIFIHGSVNGGFSTKTTAQLKAIAKAYMVQLVADYPRTPIVLSGVYNLTSAGNNPTTGVPYSTATLALDTAYGEIVSEINAPNLKYISIRTPPYVPNWDTSSLVAPDKVHPDPILGVDILGAQTADAEYNALMSMNF